jgi:penicillin-binding protein 1A
MRQAQRRRLAWRMLLVAIGVVVAIMALAGGLLAGVYSSMADVLPAPMETASMRPSEGVQVYSADGVLLGRVAQENREFVPISEIPTKLQLAAVAVEDRRFYEHHGVDPAGILGALRDDLVGRRIVRGASTITQQLARWVYLSPRRTVARKLQEIILALQIERRYSKEEILELYLNQIYFGHGAYGVKVAAQTYFDKPVSELNLAQCALLAGIPQRPRDFDPFLDPQAAKERRNEVLERMAAQGYITPEQAKQAEQQSLGLGRRKKPLSSQDYKAPYFTNYVLRELVNELGADAVYRGDLAIHTTLDWSMQRAAEQAVEQGVSRARGLRVSEGALVAMDYRTGAIKALVGGTSYRRDQYSCATQARRQAGSAFKLFVYTAAMDSGFTPESIFHDSPVSYPGASGRPWRPQNADRRYRGRVTLRSALVNSINVVAVKLLSEVGVPKVVDYAHRMGIRDPLDPYLSLALGTSGVTVLDMATSFGTIANRGRKVEPRVVDRIIDRNGNIVAAYQPRFSQVISEATAATMDDMLREVVTRGTGRRARIKWTAAGKTGTASDYKDAWFVGYTDKLVCAVWVGNRDNTPMRRVFGGTVPASIWASFMTEAMQLEEQGHGAAEAVREEPRPVVVERPRERREAQRVLRITVCADSGKLARPECPETRILQYPAERADLAPKEYCDVHGPGAAPPPPRTITLSVCEDSGKLATENCPHVVNKSFAPDQAPTRTCPIHRAARGPDAGGTLW